MNWFKQLLSGDPGASFGRAACIPFILAVIIWISYFLWSTAHTPAGIRFPDLTTIGALNALAISFYGLGKGMAKTAEIFGNRRDAEGVEKKAE